MSLSVDTFRAVAPSRGATSITQEGRTLAMILYAPINDRKPFMVDGCVHVNTVVMWRWLAILPWVQTHSIIKVLLLAQ